MDTENNVPVKSAWLSKINWVSAGGAALTLAAAFVSGLPPEQAVVATAAINIAQSVATVIFRTFFNRTVTPD